MAYVMPKRNPLRRVPVRMYRSPLAIAQFPGLGALNCPGDAGCPGNPIQIGPTAVVTVTPDTTTVQDPSGNVLSQVPTLNAGSGTITDFLNQNSKTILWIGGVMLAVLVLGRLGR